MAAFKKNAKIIGAGPLIVIETLVFLSHKLNPEYRSFASSIVAIDTPEFPTFPPHLGAWKDPAIQSHAIKSSG